MTIVRSLAVLPLMLSVLPAQTPDFRNTTWGMDRAQVVAAEGTQPSRTTDSNGETVLRYEPARLAGLDCRVVYIFAKDKLVRTKYIFQQIHDQKRDFLEDFALIDTFLAGSMGSPKEQRVSWRDDRYKADPQNYGLALSLGQLLYSTQWTGARTVLTHALTGNAGTITHEVEYVSVDLEPWENQVTKEQEVPARTAPIQTAAAP